MTSCPTCQKLVDPLRSRFVAVQDGKIVAYCSVECARSAQRAAGPAAAPGVAPPAMERIGLLAEGTPAALPAMKGAFAGATGVPAHISTPPAGTAVVARTSATDASSGPPRPVTPAAGVPIDADSGPVIQILHEPTSGDVSRAPDESSAPAAAPSAASTVAPSAASPSAPARTPGKDSGAVRTAAAVGPARAELPGDSAADALDRPDSGAGARSRGDRARSEIESDGDVAPARKSRTSLVLFLLLLVAVGGFVAYRYLVKHDVAAATQVRPPPGAHALQAAQVTLAELSTPPRPPPPPVEAAPAVDVAAVVEQARAVLRAGLAATSPRLSRIAAAALARTQDRAACDSLAEQIGFGGAPVRASRSVRQPEPSDIARLDLAYSLARGGDQRGSDALAAALRSPRADARDEAARLLALLGDRRGVPHLTDVLAVSQRRLGAAAHLAHLADPRTIKVLDQIRGDARTSPGDKARATIALGFAGRADVAAALRGMLDDAHFNAFAAVALAELKDAAARPVLEHQLESPVLRVRAARALRRLDPVIDPRPVLPPLLDVLKSGRDIDQLQAAEAILLLAGPERWAAYE